jgi:putative addiction module component (TIGR02574 family)
MTLVDVYYARQDMHTSDEIFNAVQSLSPSEQWGLFSRLWAALPHEATPFVDDDTLAEWDRRIAEMESGAAQAIPGEQVREYLRSKIKQYG